MQRGRPRKPLPALLLEGRYRADRHGEADAVWLPDGGPSTAPEWLSADARLLWDQLAPQLSGAGVATDVDRAELSALCDWWARYREALRTLDEVEDRKTTEFYRLSILASMAWKNFASAAGKFGLNPSDRARLRLNHDAEPEDALTEFTKARE